MAEIKINYKSKYLTIVVHPMYDYDISFDRLRKREAWWFDHLCSKIWFTPETKVAYGKAISELKKNKYGKAKNG
jgi:hypothetical protein